MLAARHGTRIRSDGRSALAHCVLTALHLADLGLDAETVAGGLLHDALRNNPAVRSQLEEFLPSSVVHLVDRVTTISEISELYRDNQDALGDEKMRRSEWRDVHARVCDWGGGGCPWKLQLFCGLEGLCTTPHIAPSLPLPNPCSVPSCLRSAAGHGGCARRPRQARVPRAEHGVNPVPAGREAAAVCAGDARHLRGGCEPVGHLGAEGKVGGPRVLHPAPGGIC